MAGSGDRSAIRLTLVGCAAFAAGGCADLNLAGGSGAADSQSILTIFSPPDPGEAARMAADPFDPDKRQRGMLLLANAPWGGDAVYLAFYRASLADEDPAVRGVACLALGRHGTAEDADALIAALSDPEVIVRRSAATALQRLHDPAAIRPLLRVADERLEEDAEARAAAAAALGQYADPQVVQGLIAALRDSRLLVNQSALESLTLLTGQDFRYDIGAWLEWTRQTDDLFAGRGRYVYPVYRRSPKFWEQFVPWMQPPNETASVPAGLVEPTPPPPG